MPTPIEKLVLIEKITEQINNRYEAVRVMAKEARRLNALIIRGAQADADFKPTTAAVQRVIDDKIKYEYVQHTEEPDELFEGNEE
jgi:DNA-directed RNA polymerase subunit K/omega